MLPNLLFIAGLFVIGIILIIFAKPIAIREYNFDLRWKMTFGIGINIRVWSFRIIGLIIIGTAIYAIAMLGGVGE